MILYQYRGNIINLDEKSFSEGFKYLKKLLENGEINFSKPAKFNDPFDCCPAHLNDVPDNAFPHAIGASINQTMQSFTSKIHGVVCLTRHSDKMLMWSHYGDQHRGVCVGFDTELLIDNSPKNSKGNRLFEQIVEVVYTVDRPINGDSKMFYKKSKEWKDEDEYRIISTMQEGSPAWGPGTWNIPKNAIKEIIIGARLPTPYKEEINNWVKFNRPDVEVKISILHMKEFKLLIENYDDQPIIAPSSGYIHGPNDDWISTDDK